MFSASLETRCFSHTNGNLYHYAGNNPVKYTDPDGNSILSGLVKTLAGSAQAALGSTGALLCTAGAAALLADDATLIGVLDDPLALALAAGATASTLYAASGVKLASDGLNETADGVSAAAHNLIQSAKTPASAASPNPLPPNDDNNNDSNHSAKDAKKIKSNNEANNFAQEKGYKDAHELKKDYVGKNNISKFDIYRNNSTGESFLINKTGTVIVPID